METLWNDIRYALRTFRANPGLTAVAALSLAIGIGPNAAVFSLIDGLGFRTIGQMYDTTTWPVTYVVVESVNDLFSVFVLMNLAGKLGVEHTLLRFSETPGLVYSDVNGYGPYLPGFAWLRLYWTAFAVLLGVTTLLFWVRGNETGWRVRLRIARARLRSPLRMVALGALVVFSASGAWIF